jgi:hypothetical protein
MVTLKTGVKMMAKKAPEMHPSENAVEPIRTSTLRRIAGENEVELFSTENRSQIRPKAIRARNLSPITRSFRQGPTRRVNHHPFWTGTSSTTLAAR